MAKLIFIFFSFPKIRHTRQLDKKILVGLCKHL